MTVTERSDAELLARARAGDGDAVGELFARHRKPGLRLARSYRASDPEDLVSEAFERVLTAIRRGRGPDEAFRPYLFVTIRRLAGDHAAQRPAEAPLDELPESLVALTEANVEDLTDRALAIAAFTSLPDRLQTVLWHTAVEGHRPREVARATGMPANTVSVMASRARERLRQSYLQAHLGSTCPEACRYPRAHLGRYVRGKLARRHRAQVDEHLEGCQPCRALADELSDVNRTMAQAVLPLFLVVETMGPGGAATAAATASATAGAAASGAVAGGGTTATTATTSGALGGVGLATVAKVTAGVAAVAGLVAVSPLDIIDRDRSGSAETVTGAADGPARTTGHDDHALPGQRARSDHVPTTAPGAADAGGGDGTAPPASVELGIGEDGSLEAGVELHPVPGVEIDVDAGVAPDRGVELDASWRAGLLGRGTLAVELVNPGTDALAGGEVVIDLSAGARATSLAGTACQASDPSLVGAVLDLLGSLTCSLGTVAGGGETSFGLPLMTVGTGPTATVRVVAAGDALASTVVPLR
jgi:RNA polymerase sigma factor (sigma-70 family)